MKTRVRALSVLLLLGSLLCTHNVIAQDQTSRVVSSRLNVMTTGLNLNADQQAAVKSILESYSSQSEALRLSTDPDKGAKVKALALSTIGSIRPLLSLQQQVKLDQMPLGVLGVHANNQQ